MCFIYYTKSLTKNINISTEDLIIGKKNREQFYKQCSNIKRHKLVLNFKLNNDCHSNNANQFCYGGGLEGAMPHGSHIKSLKPNI
jgi:hypothetical protein